MRSCRSHSCPLWLLRLCKTQRCRCCRCVCVCERESYSCTLFLYSWLVQPACHPYCDVVCLGIFGHEKQRVQEWGNSLGGEVTRWDSCQIKSSRKEELVIVSFFVPNPRAALWLCSALGLRWKTTDKLANRQRDNTALPLITGVLFFRLHFG